MKISPNNGWKTDARYMYELNGNGASMPSTAEQSDSDEVGAVETNSVLEDEVARLKALLESHGIPYSKKVKREEEGGGSRVLDTSSMGGSFGRNKAPLTSTSRHVSVKRRKKSALDVALTSASTKMKARMRSRRASVGHIATNDENDIMDLFQGNRPLSELVAIGKSNLSLDKDHEMLYELSDLWVEGTDCEEAGKDFVAIMTATNKNLTEQAVTEWAEKYIKSSRHEDTSFGKELKAVLRGVFKGARPLFKMYKIGLAIRLGFSLFTCYGDVATDAFMTVEMFRGGRFDLAIASSCAMLANMFFQITIIFMAGPTDSTARLRDVLLVIFQLKPAFDSYRVLFDSQIEEGQFHEHEILLAISRGGETALESFPESVIQTAFLFSSSNEGSTLNLMSIAFSFLSMGFGLASASIDIDLSPTVRKTSSYHGYTPLSNFGEFSCISALTLINTSCIMARTAAVVASTMAFGAWFPGMLLLFELACVNVNAWLRGEFYWDTLRDESDVGKAFMMNALIYLGSCIVRFVQFRIPLVIRGIHFLGIIASSMVVNMVSAGASSFYLSGQPIINTTATNATGVAEPTLQATNVGTTVRERDAVSLLFTICVAATALEILSWIVFFLSMVADKRKWFTCNISRREYIRQKWNGGFLSEDKVAYVSGIKISLEYYRAYWVATRMPRYLSDVDVKGWIEKNKERWNDPETMPDFWHIEAWRKRAADCCGIPVDELGYAPKEAIHQSPDSETAFAATGEEEMSAKTSKIVEDEDLKLSSKSRKMTRRGSHHMVRKHSTFRSQSRNQVYKTVFGEADRKKNPSR